MRAIFTVTTVGKPVWVPGGKSLWVPHRASCSLCTSYTNSGIILLLVCSYPLCVSDYVSSIRVATLLWNDGDIAMKLLGMHWLLCDCLWHWVNMSSLMIASNSSMWLPAVNPSLVLTDRSDYMDSVSQEEVVLQIMNLYSRGYWSMELCFWNIHTFTAVDSQPLWLPR